MQPTTTDGVRVNPARVRTRRVTHLRNIRLKWAFTAWDEILRAWGYAEDLDTFERFGLEAANVVLGGVGLLPLEF
jgi:hypothetical protein